MIGKLTIPSLGTGGHLGNTETITRISTSALSQIIPEVCESLYNRLQPIVMPFPQSPLDWLQIAYDFEERWNYPFCIGKNCIPVMWSLLKITISVCNITNIHIVWWRTSSSRYCNFV